MLGASLFPAFHHLPALSRPCPFRYLGSSLAAAFLVLTFPHGPSSYTREESNDDEDRHTSMYSANVGAMREKDASTTCMYICCTCVLRYMYNDNLSFLLVHPICRSIDLSVGLYRASLRDDKFQLTLINFLLCRRRSNFCHIKGRYDKVIHIHIRVHTYVHARARIRTK